LYKVFKYFYSLNAFFIKIIVAILIPVKSNFGKIVFRELNFGRYTNPKRSISS